MRRKVEVACSRPGMTAPGSVQSVALMRARQLQIRCILCDEVGDGMDALERQGCRYRSAKRLESSIGDESRLMLSMAPGWTICHDRQIGNEPEASQKTAVRNGAM
ncbi:hypothetical protein BDP81DRAFT_193798 [Colletotrichum phormii]|uniref:Uncharacterized protein n=1 Tax=Colletotrichum phormii TaxID=359342 RepID=A0AAJ0EG52_9PEZI|nr:uncharacterized protein BDP81DRAFT_193798 [Colletotrichum phormii]KAK1638947.1 hypothetical protein BDP81DRAFT_193798 [Colletotrichum phormii]